MILERNLVEKKKTIHIWSMIQPLDAGQFYTVFFRGKVSYGLQNTLFAGIM